MRMLIQALAVPLAGSGGDGHHGVLQPRSSGRGERTSGRGHAHPRPTLRTPPACLLDARRPDLGQRDKFENRAASTGSESAIGAASGRPRRVIRREGERAEEQDQSSPSPDGVRECCQEGRGGLPRPCGGGRCCKPPPREHNARSSKRAMSFPLSSSAQGPGTHAHICVYAHFGETHLGLKAREVGRDR